MRRQRQTEFFSNDVRDRPNRKIRDRPNIPEPECNPSLISNSRPIYTVRRKRTASNLFYCIFLLIVCPLSQVCMSVAGGGRSLVTPAMADFSDNCPRDCNCKWANGKREADCTRAGFTTIPTNLNHEIQILRMTYNYVRILGKNVYKSAGLLNLQRIFMNHCHVQEIHPDAFRDLKILVELDLSHNNISQIKPDTFAGNERLQTLTLAHNFIAQMAPYQFPPLKHLKTIDLSHNTLAEIQRHTFDNLGNSVESVYINNNLLKSVREEVFLGLANLKSLQLHSNPWACDCNLKNFRDWVVYRGLYTYPTACAEPERLADKLWQDVDPKDFACKPEIRVPQSVVFSQPGANVTLSCFIIGTPMPDAKWVLKGRIVNNNTFPVGSAPPTITSSFQSSFSSSSSSPIGLTTAPSTSTAANNAVTGSTPASSAAVPVPTQYLIHEEGGLERWFNLTIINIGIDSASDYTCVAVNAGGVMEENISLTFEEPKPVGLPGGKKEESHMAIIIGAAAGGFLFVMVLLLIFCCCCCRRRKRAKRSHHSGSTPSSSNSSRTPDLPGSIVGFVDSNSSQKLLFSSNNTTSTTVVTTTMTAGSPANSAPSASCHYYPNKENPHQKLQQQQQQQQQQNYATKHARMGGNEYQGLPLNDTDFPPPPPPCELTNLNEESSLTTSLCSPAPPSPPRQAAKTIVVSSNNCGETSAYYHSLADPDHYPDLLNIPQNRGGCYQGRVLSPVKSTTATLSGVKLNQPLNPAALVVPSTPPSQFPHQFAHLIRNPQQPNPKSTSGSVTVPLLSPPAQFGQPDHRDAKSYVTLPRRLPTTSSTSPNHRGMMDWSLMTERGVVYDGVGPRTSATGASAVNRKSSEDNSMIVSIPEMDELQQQHNRHQQHQQFFNNARLRTSSLKRFPMASNPMYQPCIVLGSVPGSGRRESSGSEMTLGDDSMSGYFEPFGKALPPAPSSSSSNGDHPDQGKEKSIVCSETDLELVLGAVGHKRQQQLLACSKAQQQQQQQQQHRQLKGILKKESSFSTKTPSITTNPCANANNIIVISGERESSASCSPPPLSEPITNVASSSNNNNSSSISKGSKQAPPKVFPKPGKGNPGPKNVVTNSTSSATFRNKNNVLNV